MKKITQNFFFFLLFSITVANAQVSNYSFSTSTGNALESGGFTNLLGTFLDDDVSNITNIGFTFNYNGVDYTQFSATSNGILRFGSDFATTQYTNNISTQIGAYLLAYWDDNYTDSNGNVQYKITGAPGSRKLIVDYNLSYLGNTGTADKHFQIWLFETSNTIQFVYGSGNNLNGGFSVGILTNGSSDFQSITTSTNTSSTVVTNDNNTTWPGSGVSYIFNGTPLITTTLNSASCGATLAGWYSTVTANGVSFAQGYRFRITKVDSADTPIGPSVDYDRPVSNISLSNVADVTYNSRYRFEVAVRYNNVWQPFGSACYVNTPTATTNIALCGSTLTSINQWITTTAVANIGSYRFRVTQLDGSLNPVGLSQEITQSTNKFNMTQFAGYLYGTTYRVEVSLRNTDGNYLPYNTPCNITTPAHPTTQLQASQCNTVATSNTQLIYANAVSGATAYMFRVSYVVPGDPGNQLNYDMTYTNNAFNRFTLNNFPGLQAGITYSVEVSVKLASQPSFGPYGSICTITTPGGVVLFKGADIKATALNVVSDFEANAYPNPFADNFKLNVTTASQEAITVSVYDMLGKQVENKSINSSEIESFEVGNNYPSGIYNVIVSQGVETKTLRVIKR